MSFYKELAFRIFGKFGENVSRYFSETKNDIRKAGMKISLAEYLSIVIMTCFMVFVMQLPILSFLFSLVFQSFLFGFLTAITSSFVVAVVLFFGFIYHPKIKAGSKSN